MFKNSIEAFKYYNDNCYYTLDDKKTSHGIIKIQHTG